MNVDKLKNILLQNHKVKFKLYSLDYIIESNDDSIILYSPTYPNDIRKYNSIEQLLNNFTVYNETLTEADDRINNIE